VIVNGTDNNVLTKTNEKKTELLNAYESYFKDLESVLKNYDS